jgi:primosomal replication protein N
VTATPVSQVNQIELTGQLIGRDALRYTPAGIPLLNVKLAHQSEPTEAGMKRNVAFEIDVLIAGELAVSADRLTLGQTLNVGGFLAPRRRQSKTLLLHCTAYRVIREQTETISIG